MSALVLDASIILAWMFEDERTSEIDAIAADLPTAEACAPGLLRVEVANVLAMSKRRGRISAALLERFLVRLEALPIVHEPGPEPRVLRDIVRLARTEGLTVYDATYLELALRCQASLASRDNTLRAAAQRLGVPIRP